MIAADKFRPKVTADTVDQITYKQAFLVGLFQCIALWPGFSPLALPFQEGYCLE